MFGEKNDSKVIMAMMFADTEGQLLLFYSRAFAIAPNPLPGVDGFFETPYSVCRTRQARVR